MLAPATAYSSEPLETANQVEKLARARLPDALFLPAAAEDITVTFIHLSDDPWKYALLQVMRVQAPLKCLQTVVDDVKGYVGIFDNLLTSERREAKNANDYVLFTESEIPIPLVANDKTSVHYQVSSGPQWSLYRFSLVAGNHLKQFEGVAGAVALTAQSSLYWEIDALEPAFGISRMLPPKKFWLQNGLANLQSDWALKLKAEGAQSPGEILAESKKKADAGEAGINKNYEAALTLEALLAQTKPSIPNKAANPNRPSGPPASTNKPKHSGPNKEPKP